MHRLLFSLLVAVAAANAQAQSTELSNASGLVAEGSAVVVAGSLSAVALAGSAVVEGIEKVGEASAIVLSAGAEGASATLRLSGRAAQELSVAVGTVVSVTAISTGYVLVSAGKVIAFVPNDMGKALLHHGRTAAPRT